ncbi:hypothetical protein [Longimicrobium terrae]|uniref:Uncharacterized protein n=1 Tax=Longimicrobium terrae TaxID=1639882 RepID=A0A841GML8_9BACT|nr:hypothetical protein [Longimicrobium terrae]MBB4634558.1 hypothetical protein [Longimicrobium terrae]MBB6068552.1 hypothetical protein [Longimicrobium terrae]NNC27740.1 hypothetical protein [Longimicrobium terrae]
MTATLVDRPPTAPETTASAPHPRPRWTGVAREQLLTVLGALRWQTILGAAALAALTLMWVVSRISSPSRPETVQFAELMIPLAMIALFTPAEVWRGEQPSRRGYFWAMPVDRTRHTLLRVLGGWAWLMAAVAVFLLWIAAASWATGGSFSLGDVPLSPSGTAQQTAAEYAIHAPVPAWRWLVPFAATTTLYLLGSIIPLASNYPWRWYGGIALASLLVAALGADWSERALHLLVPGPFGLETLLTGGGQAFVEGSVPGQVRAVPYAATPGGWLSATALWMGIGLIGVFIAPPPPRQLTRLDHAIGPGAAPCRPAVDDDKPAPGSLQARASAL